MVRLHKVLYLAWRYIGVCVCVCARARSRCYLVSSCKWNYIVRLICNMRACARTWSSGDLLVPASEASSRTRTSSDARTSKWPAAAPAIYTYMDIYTYICTYIHTYTYICTHTHTHTHGIMSWFSWIRGGSTRDGRAIWAHEAWELWRRPGPTSLWGLELLVYKALSY